MMQGYSDSYLKNQIETASREQLLLMFYDGAIRFAKRALNAIDENNFEQRNYCINKTSAIITELSVSLDHDIGGQIAQNLEALYDYMLRELIKANNGNDAEPVKVVIALLADLQETWKTAIETTKKSAERRAMPANQPRPLSISL